MDYLESFLVVKMLLLIIKKGSEIMCLGVSVILVCIVSLILSCIIKKKCGYRYTTCYRWYLKLRFI